MTRNLSCGILGETSRGGRQLKYAKLLAQVVATVLVALIAVWSGGIDPQEWVTVAIAAVTAWNVFTSPNVPGAKYSKVFVAVAGAVAAALSTFILGGVDASELMQLGVIALGALGVYAVPNTEDGVNLSELGSLEGVVVDAPEHEDVG